MRTSNIFHRMLVLLLMVAGSGLGFILAQTSPSIRPLAFDDNAVMNRMSDNGQWAVFDATNSGNSTLRMNPRLVNLQTGLSTDLCAGLDAATIASAAARDVTDDGNIVVGELNGQPAYWKKATASWTTLPVKQGCAGGLVFAVTPDGKYAVGTQTFADNVYKELPALWDLTTGKLVNTPGLPTKDMAHEDKGQNRFTQISADGKTILACMSVSYMPTAYDLGGRFEYIYHVEDGDYTVMGFTESDTQRWTPDVEGLYYYSISKLSNDGRFVTGAAYVVGEDNASGFPTEENLPFVYDVEQDKLTVLDGTEDVGVGAWCTDAQGTLLGATPIGSPLRQWSIKDGNYWIDFDLILQDKFGYNFLEHTGFENTGTPIDVSDDGRTVAVMVDPYTSYVATLPAPVSQIAKGINLLNSYTVAPKAGAKLSKLQNITITFRRNIEVAAGKNQAVRLLDADGNVVYTSTAVKVDATGKALQITFRKGELAEDEYYTLDVPAGTVHIKGDAERTNADIRLTYQGRAADPVRVVETNPAEGTELTKIDMTTSPILLTFDTDVQIASGKAYLYRDDETEAEEELLLAYADNVVAVYPAASTFLFKGSSYTIRIPAGIITDLTGICGNEAIELRYEGAYEREISADDKYLLTEDFNQGFVNTMLYEGDHNEPTDEMKAIDFIDKDNYPWTIVHDTPTDPDLVAASHSCYTNGGKSDDWMVTAQVYLPDTTCHLTFQAQSYLRSKADRLKVYAYADTKSYNYLSTAIINKIKTEGVLLFDEQLSPGATEDLLSGEWTDYDVPLADFAGKYIYLAFLNDNKNQSIVFVNNVQVVREMPFLISLDNESAVVNAQSVTVKGRAKINEPNQTFTNATLTLRDAEGSVVSTIQESGLSLEKGDIYEFTFPEALPLAPHCESAFTVEVLMNGKQATASSSVKNLAFLPKTHVVLEEYTGTTCGNCPLGIEAIDRLHSAYGDRFIPIGLHNYTGDLLGSGTVDYSAALGLIAAPTGRINRSETILSPASQVEGKYYFSNSPDGKPLWLDVVQEEMGRLVFAELNATATLQKNGQVAVPVTTRFALNIPSHNYKYFLVLLEDDILAFQSNYFAATSDPELGEWGLGGANGKSTVYPYYQQHVARSWKGASISGTGGLLPTTLSAGEDYVVQMAMPMAANVSDVANTSVAVLLIDGNTDRIINATTARVVVPEGIDEAEQAAVSIRRTHDGFDINVAGSASAQAFDASGRLVGQTTGQDLLHLTTTGHQGFTIVRVTTASGAVVVKKF
ncbi:MAG: Ig-like domain-containing protein [Alloprevotella sp.]|nr:Ig-like domain-containing protein [Alloprevotella sp.]